MTNEKLRQQVLADPELAKQMIFFGVEAMYAKDKAYVLEYTERKYKLIIKDFGASTRDSEIFNTADELKAEFFKLKSTNEHRDFEADFDNFMNNVKDTKAYWGIDDE